MLGGRGQLEISLQQAHMLGGVSPAGPYGGGGEATCSYFSHAFVHSCSHDRRKVGLKQLPLPL